MVSLILRVWDLHGRVQGGDEAGKRREQVSCFTPKEEPNPPPECFTESLEGIDSGELPNLGLARSPSRWHFLFTPPVICLLLHRTH